jgi:hypothetical protein
MPIEGAGAGAGGATAGVGGLNCLPMWLMAWWGIVGIIGIIGCIATIVGVKVMGSGGCCHIAGARARC